MGAHHNESRSAGKSGGKRRGSVNNAGRLDAFHERAGRGGADWGGCDQARLQGVVVAITELGGAITIGLSRDKGAHFMTLLLDDEKSTLWFNGDADLDAELDAVYERLAALT